MVNLQILLAVLRAGRCSDRLLRFWDARNLRKGGELMCLDMLFVDENERLSEGSLYTISGFDVTRSSPNFWFSDAPFSIRFNDGTFVEKKTESVRPIIPMDSNSPKYQEIVNIRLGDGSMRRGQVCEVDGWRENCCPVIVGQAKGIKNTFSGESENIQRIMVNLSIERHTTVFLSVFEVRATNFDEK